MTSEKNQNNAAKKEKSRRTARTGKNTEQAQSVDNVVFIGKKPLMNYIVACLTFLNQPGSKKVVVKARGRAISRAVDTTELLRRNFMKNLQLGDIEIHTEEVARQEGQKSNVSAIELTLTKP